MQEGLYGALVGGLIAILVGAASTLLTHHLQNGRSSKLDEKRKELLKRMLSGERNWRKLTTLSHVIGADEDTTKRLLLEIDARASEGGENIWGLISRNPLSTSE